jgi:hypothetical protein
VHPPALHPKPHRKPKPKPKPHPPTAPPRPAFTPQRPLRVWVGGDSLVEVPGQSLERATGSRGAVRILPVESRVATGLGRPDVYNWYTRFREVIDKLRPRVVVLSFGSNDGHDYLSGVPTGVSIGPLGSPSWVAEYRRRLTGVTEEFSRAGAYVVWIGLPITRGEGLNQPFRIVNRILRSVAARDDKASSFVDTWKMFSTPGGRYADYLRNTQGRLVLMRASDGVHYTSAAGDLLARAVLQRLNQLYDLTSWSRRKSG